MRWITSNEPWSRASSRLNDFGSAGAAKTKRPPARPGSQSATSASFGRGAVILGSGLAVDGLPLQAMSVKSRSERGKKNRERVHIRKPPHIVKRIAERG